MTEFFRYLKSDFYKLRRSWFFALHLIIPICGIAVMLLYAGASGSAAANKLTAFPQLIAIAFPFVISIVCRTAAEQEVRAGRCMNMLTLRRRRKAILSKFSILVLSGLLSVTLCVGVFGGIFSVFTEVRVPAQYFLVVPAVLWASNLMLYVLHLILALRFGSGLGISIGAAGSMLSALMETGMGDGRWFFIPYGIGIHLTGNTLAEIFSAPMETYSEIKLGILFCISVTCAIMAVMLAWFSRYGGAQAD